MREEKRLKSPRLRADGLTALKSFDGIVNFTIGAINGTFP